MSVDHVALARRHLARLQELVRAQVLAELAEAFRGALPPPVGKRRRRMQADTSQITRGTTQARPGRRPRKEAPTPPESSAPPGEPPFPPAERHDPPAPATALVQVVQPDLVLPPGFDRVGEVVRFEQDSGPAVERAPTGHGAVAGFHPVPAGEGQEPATLPIGTSGELETGPEHAASGSDPCEGVRATRSQGTLGLPGTVAPPKQRRCSACGELGHRKTTCSALPPADPDDEPESGFDCRSERSLKPADFRACTRCGLRGHVAGDPDRCLFYRGGFGLGGQAAQIARARP